LVLDDVHIGEPGPHQRVHRELAAYAVQRRQRHPHLSVRASHPGRPLDVMLDRIDTGRCDTTTRDFVGVGGFRGGTLDLVVDGWHNREPTVEVDLVAVVGRRVV
jgi:hypothetical protein